MNNEHSFQPNPLLFGIGTIIGLALGLFIGWVLWPVEWEGAALRDLDTGTKAEYVAAVADAFVIYDSPEAAANARRRLIPLEDNLAAEFSNAVGYFRNSNQAEQNIRISNIRQLASALGVLLPESGFAADAAGEPAVVGPVSTVGASTATASGPETQVTNGDTLSTNTTSGTGIAGNSSWLRSLLWLLAVILIVGGAIFLLSASGLVDWQRLMERWAAFPKTEQIGRRNDGGDSTVDEFGDADYTAFDESGRFDDSYDLEDDGFDDEDYEDSTGEQRNATRYGTDHIDRPLLHFGRPGRSNTQTTAFDVEEYPPTTEFREERGATGDMGGNPTTAGEPFADDPSAFAFDRLQRRAKGEARPVIDSDVNDVDSDVDSDSDSDSDSDVNVVDMFDEVDFAEAEETADDTGYQFAYAGSRYTDDPDRAEEAHIEPNDDDDDVDDFDDFIDDDTAGDDWRVPTVDSVLAGSGDRSRFRLQPTSTAEEEDDEAADIEQAASDENAAQRAQTRTPPQSETGSDKPAPSPFARLTNRQPAQRVIDRKYQTKTDDRATGQQIESRQEKANERPAQSPGHTPRARYKVIDQLTLQYQLGIQEYDESKPIVDPGSGKYIGEFGMGASVKNALVQANPEQVAALEVWLFDKSDEESIGNKTRILLSEYAIDNKLDENILKERQDNPRPFTAQKGVHFQLESKNLLLDCMIIDVHYIDSGTNKGMFQSIKVDMSVHQKA